MVQVFQTPKANFSPPNDKAINHKELVMISDRRTAGNCGFLEARVMKSFME